MLIIEVSAKKPKPAPFISYTGGSYTPPAQSNDLLKEAHRRAGVVAGLVKNLPYKEGDLCVARGEDADKYGDVRVLNIARTYQELGASYEWRNDNPMLVYATSLKTTANFFCTVNFLEKKNADTTQAC